jgi:DNA-binding GntR family transcriptional regulator
LREVLRQLAGEGYVLLHPNRGAQVAPMTHKTLRNFFVAAPMIYAAVSRLAAMNARPEPQIMRLKDTQLLFRGAIRDGDAAARALLNDRFPRDHRRDGRQRIPDAEPPAAPDRPHAHLDDLLRPARARAGRQRDIAADQHDQFIELIESGDDADGAGRSRHRPLGAVAQPRSSSFVSTAGLDIPLGDAPGAAKGRSK